MKPNPDLWRPSEGPALWPLVVIVIGVLIGLAFIYR